MSKRILRSLLPAVASASALALVMAAGPSFGAGESGLYDDRTGAELRTQDDSAVISSQAAVSFDDLDRNSDGVLSRDEAAGRISLGEPVTVLSFSDLDVDGDGMINPEEAAASPFVTVEPADFAAFDETMGVEEDDSPIGYDEPTRLDEPNLRGLTTESMAPGDL